jgi:hypothetical protein
LSLPYFKTASELNAVGKPDNFHQDFIMEETAHVSPDYTRPTGQIAGRKNLDYFLRNHTINLKFAETTQADLRAHFERTNTPNPRKC